MDKLNHAPVTQTTPHPSGAIGLSRLDVLSISNRSVFVQAPEDEQVYEAVCAASCTLQPAVGDQVLVHLDGPDQPAYILAVLIRANPDDAHEFVLSNAVRLKANDTHLQISAPSFGVCAEQGELRIDRLNGIYKEVNEQAGTVSLVANQVKHTIGRFIGRMRDSFRLIEGLDRTQASNIDQTAQYQLSLNADITKINAEHVVKVQSKKIDLG